MAVYHILADSEPFSRSGGGASARWIAGVTSAADLQDETIVVCPAADESWGFPYVWVAPEMGKISLLPRPLQHPVLWRRRARFYAHMLRGFVSRLMPNDAIYVHNRPEMALAMVWAQGAKQQKIPVILSINDSQLSLAPRPMVRHVAGRMARVVFPSEFLYHQAFEKYGLHMRSVLLPLGADDGVYYPTEESLSLSASALPRIVYVGPLSEERGVHVLLEASRLLKRRGREVEVLLIERADPGDSLEPAAQRSRDAEYRKRLRAMSEGMVHFAPYLGMEQVADAMRTAFAVCCPSLGGEAFGVCNVEAMGCGVPVVASCVGGIPEVFADGGGLLVPPGDAAALAAAMERLLGRTGLAKLLRREGRQSFERNYSWPRIAASYLELIKSLPYGAAVRREALP